MRIKKRKPDFILILAVLVGIGVVATMKAQADAQSGIAVNKVESKVLYDNAWAKNKTSQKTTKN